MIIMAKPNCCESKPSTKLIFACSGAADVGHISDRAARQLTQKGDGRMYCMAGLGGKVAPIVEATQEATQILAIDGCPLDCAQKTLDQAGFSNYAALRVTDLGMEKGKTDVTDETIGIVEKQARMILES
jgi:uncharacterized metal-binding protein